MHFSSSRFYLLTLAGLANRGRTVRKLLHGIMQWAPVLACVCMCLFVYLSLLFFFLFCSLLHTRHTSAQQFFNPCYTEAVDDTFLTNPSRMKSGGLI